MSGKKPEDVRLFDVRVVDRHLAKGVVSRAQVDQLLKNTPDASDKAARVEVSQQAETVEREKRRQARAEAMARQEAVRGPQAPRRVETEDAE